MIARLEAEPPLATPAPPSHLTRAVSRYAVAVAAVGAALALTAVLWPLIQPAVSPLFFAAVMVAAWYGGLGPGLVATVAATAASAYFFMPPLYSLEVGYDDVLRLVVFTMVAALISSLSEQRERAEQATARLLVREQCARREAEAATRAKDEFLAVVSHELRTPLTAILGWTGMLRTGSLTPPRAERALEVIEQNTQAQLRLVDDLLDVTRIASGRLAISLRPMNLARVVEQAAATVTPTAAARSILLTTSIPETAVPVNGDAERLRQVVLNLLVNAIKFTPPAGAVDVALTHTPSVAHVTVSDTGAGISRDFLPRVFDRFGQGDGAAALGGLGLGLAIARHIIGEHQGTISADSAGEGRGSVFNVTLPITAMPPRLSALAAEIDVDSPGWDATALRHVRVLVVDDDPGIRDFLVTVLREHGAEATGVASALDALGAISRRRPDVLVSDIQLPGEDGYALVRRLRGLPPEVGGRVPALALCADGDGDDDDRALAAGLQLDLCQSVQPSTLVGAVAALPGKRRRDSDSSSARTSESNGASRGD
jgi:signal transduction histidine kinase